MGVREYGEEGAKQEVGSEKEVVLGRIRGSIRRCR